ncbi:hypothetical protein DSLASN_05140 [Desulfoluna limicola]|uniref:Phage tail fibre protein N-terminal domain-containing protein n=1 Tax=Desulfoluna limicola TaxID=2810562 RepID=A0ABM7PCE8_9BACT|nr:phage tail protein [Desulfoluna limicola]BCS94882.1 hypothetical protein DSLASN_05140 [Desulfoluna limicola]
MAESYFTTLTNTGKAMFANSPILGTPVSFTTLAVGDGNGSYTGLDLAAMLQRTTLINEVWRGSINHISTHEENSNWLVIEAFIPSDVGDFDIREVGIFDPDGNLIAIGKYPLTYKPQITQGASKDLYIKMILEVTDTASVELKVDPTLVLATRQHVADELAAYQEMVRKDAQGNVAIVGNVSIGGMNLTPFSGMKNLIINGCMRVWQRGETFTGTAGQYGSVDRWKLAGTGYLNRSTDAPIGAKYSIDTDVGIKQVVEDPALGGQTVTLSAWVKTSDTITLQIGSSEKEHSGSGEWERVSYTAPAPAGDISIMIVGTCKLSMVQLECGRVATEFDLRHIAHEFAMCQRYYEHSYTYGVSPGTASSKGSIYEPAVRNDSILTPGTLFAVEKRTIPTCNVYSTVTGAVGTIENNGDKAGSAVDQGTSGIRYFRIESGIGTSSARFHWTADAEL